MQLQREHSLHYRCCQETGGCAGCDSGYTYKDSNILTMKFLRIILFSFIVVLHALPASGGSGILYAVNPLRESVDVYDTNALMRVDRISVGKDPSDIALSPDRRLLAVTHRGTDIESPQVLWIIDREKKEVVDKVYVFLTRYRERGEVHPLFSQDGKKIYIVEDEKDSTGFLNVVI